MQQVTLLTYLTFRQLATSCFFNFFNFVATCKRLRTNFLTFLTFFQLAQINFFLTFLAFFELAKSYLQQVGINRTQHAAKRVELRRGALSTPGGGRERLNGWSSVAVP